MPLSTRATLCIGSPGSALPLAMDTWAHAAMDGDGATAQHAGVATVAAPPTCTAGGGDRPAAPLGRSYPPLRNTAARAAAARVLPRAYGGMAFYCLIDGTRDLQGVRETACRQQGGWKLESGGGEVGCCLYVAGYTEHSGLVTARNSHPNLRRHVVL
jgi:hypothetical protein